MSVLPILCLGLLLAFPGRSIRGAAEGLLLWFHIVLPTLAPFLICCQLIVSLNGIQLLTRPFYLLFHALFGLSRPASYVMLCGLLCGYPLGAGLCADFLRRGLISAAEARYLLSICNHPSPMFLLGYVTSQLALPVSPLVLLSCLYLPVIPLSLPARRFYHAYDTPAAQDAADCAPSDVPPARLDEILLSAAETMVVIGGYIMLFSILAAWIASLAFLPPYIQALLSGLAEITTGIHRICAVFPDGLRLLPTVAAAAFGGLSGIFQTGSVLYRFGNAKKAGLSIRHYAIWKALHAFLSCMIALSLRQAGLI